MADSRRGFLTKGMLGTAVVALGGVGLSQWEGPRQHQPSGALAVLTPFSFAVVAAAAEAAVGDPAVNPVAVAHGVDAALAHSSAESQADIQALAQTLNSPVLGLLLDGRPRPFLALTVEERRAALMQWRHSRLPLRSSGANALRKLCVAAHYAQPSTWVAMGYPGPPQPILDAQRSLP